MSAAPKLRFTPDEFLDWEARQGERHEYYRGEIFQMAGGTEPHARAISNVHFALRLALRGGPCAVYGEAMRVRVDAADLFTYPDLSIVCGEARFHDARRTSLLNPTALVEVLSPSTEVYDRTTKFGFYTQIPELQAYLVVAQDRPAVDVYTRDGTGWRVEQAREGSIDVPPLGLALDFAEIYDGVDFPPPEDRLRPVG